MLDKRLVRLAVDQHVAVHLRARRRFSTPQRVVADCGVQRTSRFSHTMSVSTAPMSKHCSVSSTPKQYLPVSWLISSKYLHIKRAHARGCERAREAQQCVLKRTLR